MMLTLVATGSTYEDVAGLCGCAIGAVKSRMHRARERLVRICSETDVRTL